MKLFIYKLGKHKDKAKASGVNIERILMLSFIFTFGILILVQALLVNPSVRTFLTVDSELEGSPLGVEEYLFKQGQIDIKLMNARISNKLKILVNGDEVSAFDQNTISLNVKDGDVVEIDGSKLKNEAVVQIVNKSANIISNKDAEKIRVKSNIKKLISVRIK